MSLVHSKNYVTNVDEKSIQPNAVDIRCAELMHIVPDNGYLTISESGPKEFWPQLIPPETQNVEGKYWVLSPRSSYQFETNHQVVVPEGMAGWLIIRSTLSRNGIIMSGGLYDGGYNGMIGGTIHNLTDGRVRLEKNCRIGQFIMAESETAHLYDGHYNKNGGRSIA
jgi:deoxycytidine triphosphate deaminase